MTPTIQDTLLQLFNNVRQDPNTLPAVPIEDWQEGSVEWILLSGFHDMLEQVQQRMQQFRRMEQQLREREEQYRSIFEAVTDSLTISSLEDGQLVEVNPATCKMLGFSYDELIGKLPAELVPPDYLPMVAEGLQKLRAGGRNDLTMLTLREDGTSFPTEVHSTLFNYKGKPHLLTVSRDITDRVQAQEQLREKEEQYRAIFEATDDGLNIADLDGFFIEANPTFCRMLGYSREELIGMHYSQTTFPEYYPVLEESAHAIESGGKYQTQGLARRKDGSPLSVEAHATPFMYQGKPHMLGVMHDITERVEAEKQLREKEEQYRSIFEATSDGLIIRDLDGIAVEANPAVCKMHGYSYEEFIGLPRGAIVHPQSHAAVAAYIKAIQEGQAFLGQAIEVRKDGSTFPAEVRGSTFMYLGQPHMLTVLRDITERVEAEKQLREKEEQYRAIFEATYDALFLMDLDGFLVEVNPAFCRMFGYPYEEIIGLQASDLTAPLSLHNLAEALKVLKAGKGTLKEMGQGLRKNGTTFYSESQSTTFTYRGEPHALGVVRDITERVEAEKQLREKEEQYRAIFEASTDGLFIQELEDGSVVEVNPAACEMHGFTREEFLGLLPTSFIHPDSFSLVTETLQTIQEGGQYHARGIAKRKDGTPYNAEAHVTTFTYKGRPHLLSIVRDITEQMRAEEQFREKEEQYRSVFEATSDGLIIRDMDGYVVEANPAACSMHGYTYEEFIGLHRTDIIDPADHTMVAEYMKAIQAGRSFMGQAVDVRKDGTVFPVEVRGSTFTYLGKAHTLSVLRDITERVEAEEQLREKEEQYRSIFEASTDGLFIIDLEDSHVVEVNPMACQMWDYTHEEMLGRPIGISDDSQQVPVHALDVIRAGGRFQMRDISTRKDGTSFNVEVHATPFTYKGKPHLLAIVRDITEQIHAEKLLEQRVEERTRELSSLLEISHTVASTLQLKPLLGLILDQLKTVVDYTGSAIFAVEGEDLKVLDNRSPIPEVQFMQMRFPLKDLGLIWETMISRETIIIPDVRNDTYLAQAFRAALGELGETTFSYVRACMVVPLSLKEQVIGMLVLTSSEEEAFIPHHAVLALAIANQAAVAIENARLYEQAQALAAIEERQRLARELHDSVSQALYGISLGVHTARMQLDRNPKDLAESLDYVLELAEAALIEMRALIFELRPESLETEGLVTALAKQAAALHARQGIIVQLDLCEELDLLVKVKQDLYRVAQEALHNVVKHARASKVELRLAQSNNVVIMEVHDDGKGFNTTASFPGHLGLHSMRERVANLGGTFKIESKEGQGTTIRILIPGYGAFQREY